MRQFKIKNYQTKYIYDIAKELIKCDYIDLHIMASIARLISYKDYDFDKKALQEKLFSFYYRSKGMHLLSDHIKARRRLYSRKS